MFTGIIESVGTVKTVRPGSGGMVLSVDLTAIADGTRLGDSIAINGVCLTVSRLSAAVADFDVSAETLSKSAIGKIHSGRKVNIERAMSAAGRFGGHIVQGHIDGVAHISAIERKGDFAEMTFVTEPALLDEMVPKGSVCVDGVSLTIAKMDERSFAVSVIPTTLKETTLGAAKVADVVNIETDIITRTVKRQLEKMLPGRAKGTLTAEKLRELGF